MQEGVFIPVYKSDDETDPVNYRPISLLSIFNRIVEKLMYRQLKNFLDENDIPFKSQYGFREKHSKFRNERKHLSDDPEVILHERVKRDANSRGKSVSSKFRRGALNWEPPYPEGEDEASMKRHKDALASEWRKKNPDKTRIETWIILTFPERRRQMNQQTDLALLKAEYPSLFDYNQVNAD